MYSHSVLLAIQQVGFLLSGISGVLLAGLYYLMFRQQRRQTDLQALAYSPQLVVESESHTDVVFQRENNPEKNWFTLRNNGNVPFNASVYITLAKAEKIGPNSSLLDQSAGYESVPDEFKFSGGEDPWNGDEFFLNPNQTKQFRMEMFSTELISRHDEYPNDAWCFVRVDAEIESTLESSHSHKIQRAFHLPPDHGELIPLSFSRAREMASRGNEPQMGQSR